MCQPCAGQFFEAVAAALAGGRPPPFLTPPPCWPCRFFAATSAPAPRYQAPFWTPRTTRTHALHSFLPCAARSLPGSVADQRIKRDVRVQARHHQVTRRAVLNRRLLHSPACHSSMQPSVSLLQHAPLALLARMLARTAPKVCRTRKPEPEWNRAEVAEYLESAGFQQ